MEYFNEDYLYVYMLTYLSNSKLFPNKGEAGNEDSWLRIHRVNRLQCRL